MKRVLLWPISCFLCLFLCSWGFHAHRVINKKAVFTLPTAIAGFFKDHIDYISEHAVDADKRCYVDSTESPRHYIDIDDYGEAPFDTVPVHWSVAVEKFSERRLIASGIIPWQIERSYRNLVKAMSERDVKRVLRHAADLGHYLADAHVPLHTTKNYNGQLTNQVGIHAFWESRIPEHYAEEYDFMVGRAQYVRSPLDEAWRIVKESFALVDSVLTLEADLSATFPTDLKYAYVKRNNQLIRTYSIPYTDAYHQLLNGMVERRMRQSVRSIGDFWYSAWVDAGQPDMRQLGNGVVLLPDTSRTVPSGRVIGREEWH